MLVPSVDKNVNYLILEKLNDRDLGRVCQTDKTMRNLCRNDMFWKKRFVTRFGAAIPDYEEMFLKRQRAFQEPKKNKQKNKKNLISVFENSKPTDSYTWRKYYIDIVNWLENYYDDYEDADITGEDIFELLNFMDNKTLGYIRCFLSADISVERCGEFKNIDLLDPYRVLRLTNYNLNGDEEEMYGEQGRQKTEKINLTDENVQKRYFKLLSQILEDTDRYKIDKEQIDRIIEYFGNPGVELVLQKRRNNSIIEAAIMYNYFEYDTLSPEIVAEYIPLDFINKDIMTGYMLDRRRVEALRVAVERKYGPGTFLPNLPKKNKVIGK